MALLDDLIGVFSPKAAAERLAYRGAYEAQKRLQAQARRYEGADRGRLAGRHKATFGSADAEMFPDLPYLRANQRQLIRDNPYATTALRNLTCDLIGDGITTRAEHPDPKIRQIAQDYWDKQAEARIWGGEDFYGHQKLATRGMIEGGDTLTIWEADDLGPDGRVKLLEAEYLVAVRDQLLPDGGKIIQGVEFDKTGQVVAYHIYQRHPGDRLYPGNNFQTLRIEAQYADHLFEPLRPGQTRGAPWFHAAISRLRDINDLEESLRIKRRVEACLAVFRTPGESGQTSPLGEKTVQTDGTPTWENLRPGMVVTGQPGETLTVVNPNSSGGDDALLRYQLMTTMACMGVPYHVGTGDVSQANYSGLRADDIPYRRRLNDWGWNTIVPRTITPAFNRVMRRAALLLRKPELLQVVGKHTLPPRAWVDPLKDGQAELMEIRSIPGAMDIAMAERGMDLPTAIKRQQEINAMIDAAGLVLDSDPRRSNGMGGLQPAAGYIAPKGGADNTAG
jgi:lambda family phage portal protein